MKYAIPGIRISATNNAPKSAYPTVKAIGVKSLLSTLSNAKSGKYAVMIMRVAKKIGLATSFARLAIVFTVSSLSGLSSRFFRIVSIITMAPSTIIPKSIAPNESKFAGMLVTFININATSREIGIVIATNKAPRQLPNTTIRIRITKPIPSNIVLDIVDNVVSTNSVLSKKV